MTINSAEELQGMQAISEAVAVTLLKMKEYAEIGMSCKELDEYGAKILKSFKAKSAPKLTYDFPGYTCICVGKEVAHGIPSKKKVLKNGDLVNIDVSAELNGFWSDNGGSFVLGEDINNHMPLVRASQQLLRAALDEITDGFRISHMGRIVEQGAKKLNYTVIKNLAGHGVGRSLHEQPDNILNYEDRWNRKKFKKDMVVAVETFIATRSTIAESLDDGWTLVGNKGGYVTQHEHTILITDGKPILLTEMNGVFDF